MKNWRDLAGVGGWLGQKLAPPLIEASFSGMSLHSVDSCQRD